MNRFGLFQTIFTIVLVLKLNISIGFKLMGAMCWPTLGGGRGGRSKKYDVIYKHALIIVALTS